MAYLFLDTNIFLHYQPFDQINWLEIFQVASVTIVVPPITVRELNKHKDSHPRARIKNRAGDVLKRLQELFEMNMHASLQEHVNIVLEDRDPLINFTDYHLNPQIQDDHLIASMLMYKNEHADARVMLATSDAGLILLAKAKRHSLEVAKLPDNFKVAEELDPAQERIKELEDKVRVLDSRVPQLLLTFSNGNLFAKYPLQPPFEPDTNAVEEELKEIKRRYPKLRESGAAPAEDTTLDEFSQLSAIIGNNYMITPEQISGYNGRLDEFYLAYRNHLEDALKYKNMTLRTVELTIRITNDGTAPAEDMDVFMHFPDGFTVLPEHKYPQAPQAPEPPSKPKTEMERLLDSMQRSLITPYFPRTMMDRGPVEPPPNVSSFNIRRTKSYDVSFHVDRLKHNLYETAEPLYVVFNTYEEAFSFGISYRILAANVPREVSGDLHVVIQKANE